MKKSHLRPRDGSGFTLVELLVVIVIIALISAVALPVVLPALDERRVSEAARELQGALAGARDAAIRANAPRGIRLLPDPILSPLNPRLTPNLYGVLASNRYVPIEPGPDYTEGTISAFNSPPAYNANAPATTNYFLQVVTSNITPTYDTSTSPPTLVNLLNEPTGWYFNIRQGDKIRFNDSGAYYTIAGPMFSGPGYSGNDSNTYQLNVERFINLTNPDPSHFTQSPPFNWAPTVDNNSIPVEFLSLVNGVDDDGDGWIDEGFDGIDNDGDGIVDPGYNGLDDNNNGYIDEPLELFIGNEWEIEQFLGDPPTSSNLSYTIVRRAVISPGTREVTLPDGIVIDMTTWNSPAATTPAYLAAHPNATIQLPERSRLPVDPYSYSVDILVSPSGQVVQAGAGAGIDMNSSSPTSNLPFYHFWLTERRGVVQPLWGPTTPPANSSPYVPNLNPNGHSYLLPMPQGTANYSPPITQPVPYLTGQRRLVTMFTRSGLIVTNSIEPNYTLSGGVYSNIQGFNGNDISQPFYNAQAGIKESQ